MPLLASRSLSAQSLVSHVVLRAYPRRSKSGTGCGWRTKKAGGLPAKIFHITETTSTSSASVLSAKGAAGTPLRRWETRRCRGRSRAQAPAGTVWWSCLARQWTSYANMQRIRRGQPKPIASRYSYREVARKSLTGAGQDAQDVAEVASQSLITTPRLVTIRCPPRFPSRASAKPYMIASSKPLRFAGY
jgi:hypothetical protein